MSEAFAKFNPNIVRQVYVLADPAHVKEVQETLKSLYYLKVGTVRDIPGVATEPFFVLGVIDFDSASRVQYLAKVFTEMDTHGSLAHRVVVANSPEKLNSEQILFTQELGARFTAFGEGRLEEMKTYLKNAVMEEHRVGSIQSLESEYQMAARRMNIDEIKAIIQRVKESGAEGEDVHRLLVLAYVKLNDFKMTEFYLKKILRQNPQNLWAANLLGKMFLKSGRSNEGIEILERLSLFHDLNGERLLTLGTAYANSGEADRARDIFEKGQNLSEGEDQRFTTGIAKTKLLQGDLKGALEIAGKDGFSDELIRFLNMRAIVEIRKGRISQGLAFYSKAEQGCKDPVVRAKLLFNMGLAHVKNADLNAAKACFSDSIRFGGAKFRRADGPLGVVNQVIKQRMDGDHSSKSASELIDIDFESLY